MPRYGESRYGLFRYGRYVLSGNKKGLQLTRACRIRVVGNPMAVRNQRETIPGEVKRLRMRTAEGEWCRSQEQTIDGKTWRVRMRAGEGPWVQSVRYEIRGE